VSDVSVHRSEHVLMYLYTPSSQAHFVNKSFTER
jgi:hypothetical protein